MKNELQNLTEDISRLYEESLKNGVLGQSIASPDSMMSSIPTPEHFFGEVELLQSQIKSTWTNGRNQQSLLL
jgi:hypothetical protein